jgi:hypothetical protein
VNTSAHDFAAADAGEPFELSLTDAYGAEAHDVAPFACPFPETSQARGIGVIWDSSSEVNHSGLTRLV